MLIFLVLSLLLTVDAARILGVFMTPSFSHQIVYQPVWKELSLRGHQVTVLTTNPLNDPTLKNLTEIDMSVSYEYWKPEVSDMINPKKSVTREMMNLYERVTEVQLSLPEVQALIKDETAHFDLVLVEMLYPVMYAWADRFKCPMVGISSLGLFITIYDVLGVPTHPVLHPEFLFPYAVDLTFFQRVHSVIYNNVFRAIIDVVFYPHLDKLVRKYFGDGVKELRQIMANTSLVLVNRNLAFHGVRPTVPAIVEISGLHIKEPKPLPDDLKTFLDDAKEGAVYFSLGTNVESRRIEPVTLKGITEVLEDLPYKVMWKFEGDIKSPAKNVFVKNWFPQQDVLAHSNVKLFITQGGLQSMEEAIYREVPMLVVPCFVDQQSNGQRVEKNQIGLSYDITTFDKATFRNAIIEIIKNPIYKENVKTFAEISKDTPWSPLEQAVWWIEYVLRHNGAYHLRNKARDLPRYQYYLLDVISFLIVCVLGIVYILKTTLRIIASIFRKIKKPHNE